MANVEEEIMNAERRILEAVIFENWLRFYFIREEAGNNPQAEPALKIEVPLKNMEQIKNLYPGLLPLAERLNNMPVDFEISRKAVLDFALYNLESKTMPRRGLLEILESGNFQIQLQLFQAWLQTHEEELDSCILPFGQWLDRFYRWRREDGARKLAEGFADS